MTEARDFFGTPIHIGDIVACTDPESSRKTLVSGPVVSIGNKFLEIELPDPWFNEDDEISEDNQPTYTLKKKFEAVVVSPLNRGNDIH